ncbi:MULTISPECIES: Hint domain-containing protein [Rhodobacterales]|uniref:Hint domain-containing protein n=1 Tax=Ascidiaceihabitans sp. TaxID=1872644 RepID=UPI00329714F2
MSWIATTDHNEGRFAPSGLGSDRGKTRLVDLEPEVVMPRGTLVLETRMSPNGRPQVLLGFERRHPFNRSFSIQAIPGGGVALVHAHDNEVTHATLRWRGSGRTDVVRLTYAWDVAAKWGRLSLERPEEATSESVFVQNAKPLSAHDIRDFMLAKGPRDMSADAVFAAVSTQIEPIGPSPTLCLSAPIATPWGYRAAGQLQRGDLVQTERSGSVPVLNRVQRTVPALGSYRPIRLRAPYFGLRQDMIAAPDQRLIIRGSEVEYLFGQEAVLVPARHLVNGYAAHYEDFTPLITYTHLLLPGHEEIMAAGTSVESLYIGRLRRKAEDLNASVLAGSDRSKLPEHGKPVFPVLRAFEAITLVDQRAA